jgi:hypothetical protein
VFFVLQAALDPIGDISVALQVAVLFLLIIGLPFVRGAGSNKNLMWHGYSTVVALALHSVLIFLVMVTSLADGIGELAEASFFFLATVISHIVLGTLAEILGVIIVILWLLPGPKMMACGKRKKWMMPIFIIWIISVINGLLIHFLGML